MSITSQSSQEILDGYVGWRVRVAQCDAALADDLDALDRARWLCHALRADFEQVFEGTKLYGSVGNFDGLVADQMPSTWVITGESVGRKVWKPDGKNPAGRWFADAASRLLTLPEPEILDAILRRHGLAGSKDPAPQSKRMEDGWAIIQFRSKPVKPIAGVTRDSSVMEMWRGPAASSAPILAADDLG